MSTLQSVVFVLVAGGMLALGAIGFLLSYRLLERLRLQHPQVWISLGRPRMIGSVEAQGVLLRYLRSREYNALSDPVFSRLAERMRLLNRIGLVLVFGILVLFGLLVVL